MDELSDISARLDEAGFLLLGGFYPQPDEEVPALDNGARPAMVLMVGSAGHDMWRKFAPWYHRYAGTDPLDTWTQEQLLPLARDAGMSACFPFHGPPYWPFQRWANRCAPVWPSPLGIIVHHRYGLWHGLRAALLSHRRLPLPPPSVAENPCLTCREQPCLHACPVSAFDGTRYQVSACAQHLGTADGEDCMNHGCAARRACPIGQDTRYPLAQMRFHMSAFKRAH
ncbi:MAG: hypothetical protein GKR94_19820 [Gammaproteobacteria bacterium]|nr:hypothetical protein [Gammaproteobacteria bacterium]